MNPAPSLSPHDHTLLTRLIDLDEDFQSLATETSTPLLDLYTWASQPHIRELLNFHREHEQHLHQRAARRTLHEILTTDASPIERRRAATTLLRALRPTGSPRPSTHPSRSTSPPHPTATQSLATPPAADTPHANLIPSIHPPSIPLPTPPILNLSEEDLKYLRVLGVDESLLHEITGSPQRADPMPQATSTGMNTS